jgi:ATP-dependent DNA helicase DinG
MHLEDIFGAQGPLQQALPDFRFRRQQLRMAERIADALAQRSSLIVEAGTGTGKTFAYLVPALLSGARVLISTGTRTLQDQLYTKDLPLVSAAIGRPARVALLKGRANYLCRHRLQGASEQAVMQMTIDGTEDAGRAGMLARIERWARTTRTGDLSEVHGLSDSHPIWPQVTSTRDNCLGQRCREVSRCHVVAARRAAQEADVVVVNHHLLLADLALKEDGFGDILGTADAVILDEAHQIPDLATQFFGATVSSRRIENLLKDVRQEFAGAAARGDISSPVIKQIESAMLGVEEAARDLLSRVPKQPGRISWSETETALGPAVRELALALSELSARLAAEDEEAGTGAIAERVLEVSAALDRIASPDETDATRAVETTQRGYTLSLLPFDVSERFRSLVEARPSAWIFTSATLSLGEDFSHFASRLGLDSASTLKIDSPFDYERQSLLYLPTAMPDPSSPEFIRAVVETAVPLIDASLGGAFVLFTSHRALAQAAQLFRARWKEGSGYKLYVQGEAPRERLLADFREDGAGVLLGTTSFWEGVDVKGEALRLVIIEKLPFASPDDPIVKARIDHYQARGGNAFRDYQLPEAVLALKQGVGRLIRSEEDYGAVVICDPRIVSRSYGRVFRASLPAMTMTRDADEAIRFLRRHAPATA